MEPTDALRSIETVLRIAIRDVLGQSEWAKASGAPPIERLRERQEEERKRRDGAVASDNLLDYAETHHLTKIIEKTGKSFSPSLRTGRRRWPTSGLSMTYETVLLTVEIWLPMSET